MTANITTDVPHAAQSSTAQAAVIERRQAQADPRGDRQFWQLSTSGPRNSARC